MPSIEKKATKATTKKQQQKKATNLDCEELKNYRPIAHLKFLAKTVERIMVNQLQNYLTVNNLFAKTQSAYRAHHSCETALIRVINDILLALDKGDEAVLLLLDYLAAFDTVRHNILFTRFSERGICGKALELLKSYFQNRTFSVVIDGNASDVHSSPYGVPQGSVLGPVAFTLYVAPLYNLIRKHLLDCVMYADDTQIYVMFSSNDKNEAMRKLQECMHDMTSRIGQFTMVSS